MMKKLGSLFAFCLVLHCAVAQISVVDLRCENRVNPIGLDIAKPRFAWKLTGKTRNIVQTAYEIRVATTEEALLKGKNLVWTSGKVNSEQSVYVEYNGTPLASGEKYHWQVRVWDAQGTPSVWSAVAHWQTAFFNATDWKAKWIKAGFEESAERPSPIFRKAFKTGKKIQSATVFVTAQGLYEAFINGKRVGDAYLTPGWTSYNKRTQYQQYDVTNLLKEGANAVGVALGSGWYRGFLAWQNNKDSYGKEIALLFQLEIRYKDGTKDIVVSDETWKSSVGAIMSSEIYHGERIDNRLEKTGWTTEGYNDASWSGVKIKDNGGFQVVATYNEPVRRHETFKPVKILTTPKGERVIDFGQNLVGFVQVRLSGKAGDSISIQHAEVLDKFGNFYTENLRFAEQKNTYILRGDGEETFEPHFTFQGFRYVKINGWQGDIKPENFTAVALYSDMPLTGSFTCSNPLLNQLQHNIQWGQNGNFLDVPTDCPQRDERLGWTGDAQVFSRTAVFNRQAHNFFIKWLKDLALDQLPNGSVPFVVPNVLGQNSTGATGWADAATIIPWNLYLAYGDKRVLEEQYASMKAWVGFMEKNSKNDLWNVGFHFGDWLFYSVNDDNGGKSAVSDKYMLAQSFYVHSTEIMLKTAKVLGKTADVAYYSALLQRVRDAYVREYVSPNGRVSSNTQTGYVLALNFDLLPEALRGQAADRLADNIKAYNDHLTTGFLGTPYLCHVLSRFGKTDVAYKLLLQETYPSWLYPVKMGATTIWERWDGIKTDSTFEEASMNSFNHYAYGAIGDWMYRAIAGIDTDPDAVGYKRSVIKPHLGGNLTHASATLRTYYGDLASSWKIDGTKLTFDVTIPANTRATVYIPTAKNNGVLENGQPLSAQKDVKIIGVQDNYTLVELGSGTYHFEGEL